ncbi:MAG: sigma-70 family RNA polymerase sigma factor [Chthonomonadaceae bacterium]|nr:sigma-70 family RNA polymerase sigma factor [Chthonomonadaceae bacterium]
MSEERPDIPDEDGALIARFLEGDVAAFDPLFLKYQDYVYNIIYGVIGNAEEARDLTQEVFVQAYRSLHQFRRGARFATWLYRIALNRALDAARGAKRWRFLPLLDPSRSAGSGVAEVSPDQAVVQHSEREVVQQALQRCPLAHRDVLVLRYYQQLSLEEIADVLGCSLGAVKVRLHRARRAFKDHYAALCGSHAVDAQETEETDVAVSTR